MKKKLFALLVAHQFKTHEEWVETYKLWRNVK